MKKSTADVFEFMRILIREEGFTHREIAETVGTTTKCEGEEERLLRQHVATCAECRHRYDRRARLSERFSLALMDLEESVPIRPVERRKQPEPHPRFARLRLWWSRKTVRVLAITTVILTLGAAVTPARAWVVAGFEALKSLISSEPGLAPPEQQDAPVVHFALFGEEFLIEFTEAQSSGTLSLVVDTVPLASTRILGDRRQDELSVLRSGLRVSNTAESSASYEVTIPHTCKLLEVRIAGRVVRDMRLPVRRGGRSIWRRVRRSGEGRLRSTVPP